MADILSEYVAGLSSLLAPPPETVRGVAAAAPPSYDANQLELAQQMLFQSVALQDELVGRWEVAEDAHDRSVAEVQLLGAAAADLAVAERLARSASDEAAASEAPFRGATTGGNEALIMRALNEPEKLLKPARISAYRARGREARQLQAATWECLQFVRNETVDATKDALANLLVMDLAVLKEAAEIVGDDLSKRISGLAAGLMKMAVAYVLSASDKVRTLIGPENEEKVKQAAFDFIDRLQEEEYIGKGVDKFLNTGGIYEESKVWIQAYDGGNAVLTSAAEDIAALQGSFRGRIKIADVVIKGLAVAKLLPPLNTPPWGPLGIAAAYLGVIGYVLYSAHDHVDSDRYPFFDRVQGVRGTLIADLGLSGSAGASD